ncbi:hypothetical protein D9758_011768 [Tetrapyrgos nigripes]|uniref:Uncharacterized protein n=1 Tax=Tetrapyrgos nigripes TaxID=182062 RepID=A0A8H5CY64_9AGAR|nr:hypothetical protein D9758_011768 [Tetrapyrgos nigripes]
MPPSSSTSSASSSTVLTTVTSAASKATLFVVGLYLVRGYITERLEDVKEKLESDRTAGDILKRRFEQTQEDVGYTVMAMLPSLAEGIIEEMDVEEVTKELKGLGKEKAKEKERQSGTSSLAEDSQLSTSGLRGWVDTSKQHSHSQSQSSNENSNEESELSSSFVSAGSNYGYTTSSIAASASASNLSVVSSSALSVKSGGDESDAGSVSGLSDVAGRNLLGPYGYSNADLLNASVSSFASLGSSLDSSVFLQNLPPTRPLNISSGKTNTPKSKSALWLHLLRLTLTRTLLTSYTISLLSLFTTLQLTLLARAKYVRGIMQKAKEEEVRERIEENVRNEFSFGGVLMKMIRGRLGMGSGSLDWGKPEELYADGFGDDDAELSFLHRLGPKSGAGGLIHAAPDTAFEALSTKYLTLSYHFLHVGWRDLSDVVREAVIATLSEFYVHDEEKGREEKVTLKTKLSPEDFRRLIRAIRRRIEGRLWDLPGDADGGETSGHLDNTKWIWTKERIDRETEKREMFCGALLPKTQEEVKRALEEGGWRGDGVEYPGYPDEWAGGGYKDEEEDERRNILSEEAGMDSASVNEDSAYSLAHSVSDRESTVDNSEAEEPSSAQTSSELSQASEDSSQLSSQDQFQTSHLGLRGASSTTPLPPSNSHPLPVPPNRSSIGLRPLPSPTPPLRTSTPPIRPLPSIPPPAYSAESNEFVRPEEDAWPNDRSRYSVVSLSDMASPGPEEGVVTKFEDIAPTRRMPPVLSKNDSRPPTRPPSSLASVSRPSSRQGSVASPTSTNGNGKRDTLRPSEAIGPQSSQTNPTASSGPQSRPQSRASTAPSVSSHASQSGKQKVEPVMTPPPPATNTSLSLPYPYASGPYDFGHDNGSSIAVLHPFSESHLSRRTSNSHMYPPGSFAGFNGRRTAPSPRDPDPAFTALLAETRSHIMGADFAYVLGKAVGEVLKGVVGEEDGQEGVKVKGVLHSCFTSHPAGHSGTKDAVHEKEKDKARLAALLPPLARWSKDSLVGLPNVVVDNLLGMREVKAWEGVVFGEL